MPLYDFKCSEGHKFERMVRLADFEAPQHCTCGAASYRVISAPMFSVDHTGYNCPVTDRWIGSKYQHEENLKRQDCRVLEPGEKELNMRKKAESESAFDRSIDETVDKAWESMPSDKRERIANELTSGVEVSVDRLTA